MQKKLAVIVVLLLIGIVGMGVVPRPWLLPMEKVTQPQQKIINLYQLRPNRFTGRM